MALAAEDCPGIPCVGCEYACWGDQYNTSRASRALGDDAVIEAGSI